jgi:hypothetical protein
MRNVNRNKYKKNNLMFHPKTGFFSHVLNNYIKKKYQTKFGPKKDEVSREFMTPLTVDLHESYRSL